MYLKESVSINLLKGCMIPAIIACNDFFIEINKEFVITSGNEGKHLPNSFHYYGQAIDVRTRHLLPEELHKFNAFLNEHLNSYFYVCVEIDHIHIEYDES